MRFFSEKFPFSLQKFLMTFNSHRPGFSDFPFLFPDLPQPTTLHLKILGPYAWDVPTSNFGEPSLQSLPRSPPLGGPLTTAFLYFVRYEPTTNFCNSFHFFLFLGICFCVLPPGLSCVSRFLSCALSIGKSS